MALYTTNSPPQSLIDLTVTYREYWRYIFLTICFTKCCKFPNKNAKILFLSCILSYRQSAKFHEFLYNVIFTNFAQLYDAMMNCASYIYVPRRVQNHRPVSCKFSQYCKARQRLSMVISIKLYVERWNVGHVFRNIHVTWRKHIRDTQ